MNDKFRVLILDDDETFALLVEREIRSIAAVEKAHNAAEFRAKLDKKPDAVLVDLALPDIRGEEAIRLARGILPFTPVIIVTGSVGPKQADIACEAGAERFFTKDSLVGLQTAIKKAIQKARQERENAELKALAMREQRHEIIGTVAAGLAHDLRNVFGAIVMGGGVLRTKINPADDHILETMMRAANKGTDMVAQMMTFSKGGNGTAFKNVTAEFLLGEVSSLMRYRTSTSNIRLSVRTDVGTASVKCDPTQINTVLVNMALNAIDAMMPAGGDLWLEARNAVLHDSERDGLYVCFTIRDTGSGIPEEALPRIFEPYFSTKGSKGTGLGLAFVKSILEAHKGSVDVKTGPTGTMFLVYLPAFRNEPETPKEIFDGEGATILLVDDEEIFRTTVATLLETANYKVLQASNGAEAMAFFRSSETISALVSDLAMPVLCGQELSRHLIAQGFSVPTIFITGREFDEIIKPEAAAMLHKPFSREDLLSTLARVLTAAAPAGTIKP